MAGHAPPLARRRRPAAALPLMVAGLLALMGQSVEAERRLLARDPGFQDRVAAIKAQLPTSPIDPPADVPMPRLVPLDVAQAAAAAAGAGAAAPQAAAPKPKPCKPLRKNMPKATAQEKRVDKYLSKIRSHAASLTQFMKLMPKGGDIHTHWSGTIATEELIAAAVAANLSLCVTKGSPAWGYAVTSPSAFPGLGAAGCAPDGWRALNSSDALSSDGVLTTEARDTMMASWSIWNFPSNAVNVEAGAAHFFDSFARFGAASDALSNAGRVPSLLRLKAIAQKQNIQFYEMMSGNIRGLKSLPYALNITTQLRALAAAGDDAGLEAAINAILDGPAPTDADVPGAVSKSKAFAEADCQAVSDDKFVFRYQFHAARTSNPASVLMGLYASFILADQSPYVVGVNLVAREDDRVSLMDYKLHMRMLKVLQGRYPKVKLALHAGELTDELVDASNLDFHIREAITVAKALRIGHGVDLPWEQDNIDTLQKMRDQGIAIEINLDSNDFILGVGKDAHAMQLYHAGCVPMVISSDDLGILRSSLTANYVMLAYYNPQIKYPAIKEMVYNSITYSFIPQDLKDKLITGLNQKFKDFETAVSTTQFFSDNESSLG